MMEEDEDENGEEAQEYDADGNPIDDDEMVELQDDSVQGFFTHKGTTSFHPISIPTSLGVEKKQWKRDIAVQEHTLAT
jgi:hypothetical protein